MDHQTSDPNFDRKAWLFSPKCRQCHTALAWRENREWPDDPRLLLCPSCLSVLCQESLNALDAIFSPQRRVAIILLDDVDQVLENVRVAIETAHLNPSEDPRFESHAMAVFKTLGIKLSC